MSQLKSRHKLKASVDQAENLGPLNSNAEAKNVFFNGIVISRDDPLESKRIRVRIDSIDKTLSDDQLPWCISLNPSFLFSIPIPGEHVIIFLQNPWSGQKGRYYMGPIRSGDKAEFENFNETVRNMEIPANGF